MSPARGLSTAIRTAIVFVFAFLLLSTGRATAASAADPNDPAAVSFAWSATIGSEPAPGFANATGIDVGPDDNIYISDATRNDIQVFTPSGAFVRKIGAPGSGPAQFREAADVAARGDKLYVADEYNARVQVLNQQGALVGPVDGRQPVPNAAAARLPVRVDADASGRIFLLNDHDERLYRYSPAGNLERRYDEVCVAALYQGLAVLPSAVAFCSAMPGGVWRLPLTGPATNIGGINQVTPLGVIAQLAAAPDNTVWAYRNDPPGSITPPVAAFIHLAADGAVLGQFPAAADLRDIAASADRIFALTTNRRVRVYNWSGQVMGEWGGDAFAAPTAFEKPDRVVAAPDGTFYVLERGRKRLRHLSASGDVLTQLAPNERQGNLSEPVDMAMDGLNRLYVLDQSYMMRVMRYAQDRFDAVIPIPGVTPYMDKPSTVMVTGDMILVSQGSRTVRFDLTGRRIAQTQVQMPQYSSYIETALAGPNHLFRLHSGEPAVVGYTLPGQQIAAWGVNKSTGDGAIGPGVFVYPTDIASDLRGRVFVIDTEQTPWMPNTPARSSRVQVFAENGTYLTAFGGYGNQTGQFINPQSLAALADGRVVAADTGNNRLQIFAPSGWLPALNPLPAPEQWPGGGELRSAYWQDWGPKGAGGFREILIPPQPSAAQPIVGFYNGGMAFSTDGAQWSALTSAKLPGGTYQYAGASTLIATGGWDDAPYRSANLGRTWTRMSDKVPTGPTFIAPSPTFDADRTLFLAAYEGGLWQSTDAGDTWQFRSGADLRHYDLVAFPGQSGGRVLLALTTGNPLGIRRSTDDGVTWQVVDGEAGSDLFVSPTAAQDQTVFATGQYYKLNGVKRSTDGGLTWQQVGEETGRRWRYLTFSPTYATDHSVIVWDRGLSYLSKNGGDTWMMLTTESSPSLFWIAFAPTYATDGAIWRQRLDTADGIEVTTDGGATWRPLSHAPHTPALSLAGLPAPNKAPWATTPYGVIAWPAGPTDANFLYRFQHARGSAHINLALSPAFTTDGTAIAESAITRDGSATWQPLPFAAEIGNAVDANGSSQAAAFSPNYSADGVVLVAFDDWPSNPLSDLRRTMDHGATWQNGTIPVGSVRAIVFDEGNRQRVYAAGEGGVATSTDGGATWQNPREPLALFHARGLVARQENGVSVMYAATSSAGMWRSVDGGGTWTRLNAGLYDGYLCAAAGNADLLVTATCAGQVYLLGANGVWERAGGPLSGEANDILVQGNADSGRITVATSVGVWSAALPLGDAKKTWVPLIAR